MLSTGTGALMFLTSLQAAVSRHAGRAAKEDGAIKITSVKEGKLETTDSFSQHPLRVGEPMWRATARERGNNESVLIPPRESNTSAKQSLYSFRPGGFLGEGNGSFNVILLNSLIH